MSSRRLTVLVAPIAIAVIVFLTSCAASAPPASAAAGATHKGRGVVVDVNLEKSRIKLNHEKIEGFMDAMTMWFDVKDAALLKGIAPNDRVEFTIVEEASADVITELRKSSS